MNIQGIAAKFHELWIFIEDMREKYNFEFNVNCLQECQFKNSKKKTILNNYKLDNYDILPHGYPGSPFSIKGGLITYVHDSFKVTKTKPLNLFLTWEGQMVKKIKVDYKTPINMFNIYQAPRIQNEK